MSINRDSNVISIDFKSNKKDNGIKTFSQLLNQIIPEDNTLMDEIINDWSEEISPAERHKNLKSDLEFLNQMNNCSYS
jgi:hypothetical protein